MAIANEMIRAPRAATWQQAWASGESPPPECHHQLIQSIARCLDVRGKRILEVGAGSGHDSVELAARGAEAFAVDFTTEALGLTRRLSARHGGWVQPICGDTLRLPFASGSFDLVFSQGLLEHFSDPYPIVREQARLLRKGGFLLVDVPQKYSLYTVHKRRLMRRNAWFAGWETEFSLAELIGLLQSIGLRPALSYGDGYYPAALSGLRHLHTFDQRHRLPLRLPRIAREAVERGWRALEAAPWLHRWLMNIGVIAQKV